MQADTLQTSPISPAERLKDTMRRPVGGDPLDRLIGTIYETSFTSRSLRQTVAPHSLTRPAISRMYHKERVAVDFEVPGRTFHPEAKRRWCHSRGITYVPVYITDRNLTAEVFSARLTAEREALEAARTPAEEPGAQVVGNVVNTLLSRPETVVALTQLADQRTKGARTESGKAITGTALAQLGAKLFDEFNEALRVALEGDDIPQTPEAVDAWIEARSAG
jgi:hypothetical protein